jgi:hypothetical protein
MSEIRRIALPDGRTTRMGRMTTADGAAHRVALSCPRCGRVQSLEDDHVYGRASLVCFYDCGFHETHNFAALFEAGERVEGWGDGA